MSQVVDREVGPLTVLFGVDNGKYPQGNSLLVRGADKTVLIDPSLGMLARSDRLPEVDLIMLSHVHEDHVAGIHLFPNAACVCHEADALGLRSLDGMMDIYGFSGHTGQSSSKPSSMSSTIKPVQMCILLPMVIGLI